MPKHYFALVFDHAFQGDRHVLYEIGGGMCGSGFPDYDLYFSQKTGENCSHIRRHLFTALANSVKRIFIVNTYKNYLVKEVGCEWLQQFANVQVFNQFSEFTDYALSHRETWDDAVIVLDTLCDVPHIIEDDLAAILANMQITIPVLNTGVRYYDNKVIFTSLFKDAPREMLAPTWLVDTVNYQDVLTDIAKSTATQFIIKLTSKSTARDTVIIAKEHLPAFIKAAAKADLSALATIPLPGTDKSCLNVFINDLSEFNHTYIIRECIIPDVVTLDGKPYLPAARSVMIACYDSDSKQFDFVQSVANYWQRPERPYYKNDTIEHANLITANVQKVKSPTKGMVFFTAEQVTAINKACSINPSWTDADLAKHLPDTIHYAKYLMQGIAAEHPVTTIKATLASNPDNNILCRYLPSRLNKGTLVCNDAEMVAAIISKTDATCFVTMQMVAALRSYFCHQRADLLPKPLFSALNTILKQGQLPQGNLMAIVTEFNYLTEEAQTRLVSALQPWGDKAAPLFAKFIEVNKTKTLELIKTLHAPAMNFYKARQYQQAMQLWAKAVEGFEFYKPCHPESIMLYNNLAACFRELNQFDAAAGCYQKIEGICQRTHNQAELAKLATKQENLASRMKSVASPTAKWH